MRHMVHNSSKHTHTHTLGQAARCCPDKVIERKNGRTKRATRGNERKESAKEREQCSLSPEEEGENVRRKRNRKHKKVIFEKCERMERD